MVSIVDRFLEHSRIVSFENGGSPEVYVGSADWMPRNLRFRVETLFPVEDAALRDRLRNEILGTYLADRVKARRLLADGSHERLLPGPGEEPVRAQAALLEIAAKTWSRRLEPPEPTETPIVPAPEDAERPRRRRMPRKAASEIPPA